MRCRALLLENKNAWEMMPEDVGFPGTPEPVEGGSLVTDVPQGYLLRSVRILMLEILF